MSAIKIKLDFKKIIISLKDIPQNIPAYKQAVLKDTQIILRDAIELNAPKSKNKSPVKQQPYSKSWKIGKITGNKAEIFTDQGKLYAILEFTGAKPGIRTPKPGKKAIRFQLPDGTVIFTKKVNFPGFDPIPHVRPTLRRFLQNSAPLLYAHLDKVSPIFANISKQNKSKIKSIKTKLKINTSKK